MPEQGTGTANTSLVFHAGRLLALHEGDLPYQVRISRGIDHGVWALFACRLLVLGWWASRNSLQLPWPSAAVVICSCRSILYCGPGLMYSVLRARFDVGTGACTD